MPNAPVRLSEPEREQAIASLSDHFAQGRMTLDDFHQRVDQVLRATTRDQLGTVLFDVPTDVGAPAPIAVRSDVTRARDPLEAAPWAPWAVTAVICLVIWLATSLAAGAALYFWPVWVIGPWGAALASRSLRCPGSAHPGR